MAFASVAAVAPLFAGNGMRMGSITTQAYLESKPVEEAKSLITVKVHDDSGVQKEQMLSEDMNVLSPDGSVVHTPSPIPYPHKAQYYHYLFDAAIKLNQLGLDWSSPNHGPFKSIQGVSRINKNRAGSAKASTSELNPGEPVRRCIVLDIEGTTTPISFVTDVLFPYARANVGRHLSSTYATVETQDDIKLLHIQIQDDLENGVVGAIPVPSNNEGKEEVISALVANVEAMIKADRKITALKQLQGHIWRTGFQNGELEGIVFEDVPEAFERWTASGTKVYIYSSGSQLAQRLIFGNTKYGDLRKYLCGFFDTAVGNKREMSSYVEISESVGLDDSSEILFLTDVYQEATAAKAAGLEVIVSVRPGNGPLPDNHGLKTVNSFSEI